MNTGVLRVFIFQGIKHPTRSQSRRAANYRSETLSHCSLGALRIALCFFLLRLCLPPPPAAAKPEPLHPDKYLVLQRSEAYRSPLFL